MKRKTYLFFIVLIVAYCAMLYLIKDTQMYYQNSEYPMWMHVREVCFSHDDNQKELIVIGDSRTKACFIPKNDSQINLCVGGGTPQEGFYTLKYYSENNTIPRKLLISYAPFHLNMQDSFFGRTVAFDFLEFPDLVDVYLNDIARDPKYFRQSIAESLGYIFTPWYYLDALEKGLFKKRWIWNKIAYKVCKRNNGHHFFGQREKFGTKCRNPPRFIPSQITTKYLNKIHSLLVDSECEVYYFNTPYPYTRMENIERYIREHNKYIDSFFNNVLAPICFAPRTWFGDLSHLWTGSRPFTAFLENRLKYYGNKPKSINSDTPDNNNGGADKVLYYSEQPVALDMPGVEIKFPKKIDEYAMRIVLRGGNVYYMNIGAGHGSYSIFIDIRDAAKGELTSRELKLLRIPFNSIAVMPVAGDGNYALKSIRIKKAAD